MKRSLSRTLSLILEISGVEINAHKSKKMIAGRIICTLGMLYAIFVVGLYMVYNRNNMLDILTGTYYIIFAIATLLANLCFYHKSREISHLLEIVDNNVFTYVDEPNITPDYSWILREGNVLFFPILLLVYFVANSTILGLICILRLTIGGEKVVSLFPAATPWDLLTVNFCSQAFIVYLVAWSNYLRWVFLFVMSLEFERQCKRLCTALETAKQRSLVRDGGIARDAFDDKGNGEGDFELLRQNLVQCVRHHQKLRQTFNIFNSWFGECFSILLAAFIGIITLGAYSLIEPGNIFYKIASLELLIIAFIEAFAWCYFGNKLAEMSDTIRDCLFYNVRWYTLPSKIRRLLIAFHLIVRNGPFLLFGFSIYEATYKTFSQICRSSYSYMNILRKLF